MTTTTKEIYQLAGLDPCERGFSRPVELVCDNHRYRAAWRYEAARLVTDLTDSREAALQHLVATLQDQGYRQLKTQASFRHGTYLGSRESWMEYPDPPPRVRPTFRVLTAIRRWLSRERLPT